jgi:hypothetical protein
MQGPCMTFVSDFASCITIQPFSYAITLKNSMVTKLTSKVYSATTKQVYFNPNQKESIQPHIVVVLTLLSGG